MILEKILEKNQNNLFLFIKDPKAGNILTAKKS